MKKPPIKAKHPIQPIINVNGIYRFKQNKIVRYLLDNGGIDLNQIAILACEGEFSKEEQSHFAQLIGYSVGGYADLSYVTNKEYERATAQLE